MALRSRRSRDDEDERDDEPRSRRSSRDEDDRDEDRPSRGRSRRSSRDDDDDDEPRASRRSRDRDEDDSDDDDDRGSRRRRSSREEGRETRGRGRRSSRDEDDDEPKQRSRGKAARGFDSYKQKRRTGGGSFANEFKPSQNKGPTLIKFLEDGPFDTFLQHWLEDMPKKKSFVCHDDEYFKDYRDGCPLCDIGDKPKTVSLFNVLDLSNPRKPEVKVWAAGVTAADLIERLADNRRTSPINRDDMYFEVESFKEKRKWTTTIQPVKADDLEQDFDGMEPLDDKEIDSYLDNLSDDRSAVTQVETYDELAEIAEELD